MMERRMEQQRADHAAELERVRDELERSRLETDRAHDDADRQRQQVNLMFDQMKDLADRLERLHCERAAELARPWWRRLWGR
jgi:predicted nuclease with TOPRIM domain